MTLDKDDLIAALRLRYDHHSANAVFEAACARAGLADQAAYDARDIATLRAALAKVGDRLDHVNARLDALLEHAPATDAKDAKLSKGKADGTGDAKPEAKIDAKPEAKIDAKPEAKIDAKPDAKPEAKIDAKTEAKPDAKPDAKAAKAAEPAREGGDGVATTIALTGVDAGEGEQILICGGAAELGDWDPAKARPMAREGEHWLTTVAVPRGADITFKFLRRRADGSVVWEGGDDRTLAPAPRLEATWRASAS